MDVATIQATIPQIIPKLRDTDPYLHQQLTLYCTTREAPFPQALDAWVADTFGFPAHTIGEVIDEVIDAMNHKENHARLHKIN